MCYNPINKTQKGRNDRHNTNAKKVLHNLNGGKIITRLASAEKPNGVLGKIFTDKNGTDRFIYWDFDAENKSGGFGDWRHATGQWTIKAVA
jgi:hypothetical protein